MIVIITKHDVDIIVLWYNYIYDVAMKHVTDIKNISWKTY